MIQYVETVFNLVNLATAEHMKTTVVVDHLRV